MMRKACMEPVFFNEDGSIDEVEMTSQGAGPPLNAKARIPAERACLLHGNVRIEAFTENNEQLAEIRDGDKAAYKYIDFGEGVDSVFLHIKPGVSGGGISLKAGMPWGASVGHLDIPASVEEEEWITLHTKAEEISGIHALWLVFEGDGEDLFSLDWIEFK